MPHLSTPGPLILVSHPGISSFSSRTAKSPTWNRYRFSPSQLSGDLEQASSIAASSTPASCPPKVSPKPLLSWRRHGPASASNKHSFEERDHVPATLNPRLPLLLNKVPEVTAIFWIIKILSTTVGETGADYLAVHVGLGASTTTVIMIGFLIAALALQLRARSYVPTIYWLTVVLVSVVGTQITDLLTDKLEISLYLSTAVFAASLAATFAIWYGVERTLSIHTIVTRRRELF